MLTKEYKHFFKLVKNVKFGHPCRERGISVPEFREGEKYNPITAAVRLTSGLKKEFVGEEGEKYTHIATVHMCQISAGHSPSHCATPPDLLTLGPTTRSSNTSKFILAF